LEASEMADGRTYKVDSVLFFPHDVVDETTVVDCLGQRLTLNIDNIQGGGGQRRISVFAQYWIVNCTEHPLRYKQEKSTLMVSGTVHSPEKDGSLPLSGGHSKPKYKQPRTEKSMGNGWSRFESTIFSGTYGALATSPGICDLPREQVATLLDSNLSLETLARIAFMFNFHEGSVMAIGSQRLTVQLFDGTGATRYESDWSRGFSIDSVGISQVVG
jgi:SHR-binding domain of vacuolar-sorting associated protein 13